MASPVQKKWGSQKFLFLPNEKFQKCYMKRCDMVHILYTTLKSLSSKLCPHFSGVSHNWALSSFLWCLEPLIFVLISLVSHTTELCPHFSDVSNHWSLSSFLWWLAQLSFVLISLMSRTTDLCPHFSGVSHNWALSSFLWCLEPLISVLISLVSHTTELCPHFSDVSNHWSLSSFLWCLTQLSFVLISLMSRTTDLCPHFSGVSHNWALSSFLCYISAKQSRWPLPAMGGSVFSGLDSEERHWHCRATYSFRAILFHLRNTLNCCMSIPTPLLDSSMRGPWFHAGIVAWSMLIDRYISAPLMYERLNAYPSSIRKLTVDLNHPCHWFESA